jgi:hypothetical protein
MLIAGPIVRVGEPLRRPIAALLEELAQFLHKSISPSEQSNQPLGIVRNIKSVMPGVPLYIIIREYVDSLPF